LPSAAHLKAVAGKFFSILRQCICYHLVGSALHQLDDAILADLVDEIVAPINVLPPLSVTSEMMLFIGTSGSNNHFPKISSSSFTKCTKLDYIIVLMHEPLQNYR
jgi:hypothetical protein